ncbi:MAG: DinB family protein [Acidobacteria bacterium]|nr:DinB family protein [Acidobacteriota bacterium]
MKPAALLLAAATLALRGQAPAAKPTPTPTFAMSFNRNLSTVESEAVSAVEAMPEAAFHFAPSQGEFKGVKTFAQQAKHIASVNIALAAAILEEKPALDPGGENGPEALKTKGEVVKYLKDSFAYLHKAMDTLNEGNILGLVKSPWGEGKGTRLGFATIGVSHGFDHYGQIAVYLRMNGIIPPASRQ